MEVLEDVRKEQEKDRKVHSAFPDQVMDDVNYNDSMKAFLFLLNSRCNVSLEKTAQFVSDVTCRALLDTPVESFGGILSHDHEACFYSYGSDHQECMMHIERYLKDSMENEKDLTWNRQMLGLIQEMIHENNISPAEGIKKEKIAELFIKNHGFMVKMSGAGKNISCTQRVRNQFSF